MLIPFEDEERSEMSKILESYSNFMMSKIISNANDKVGLILYNIVQFLWSRMERITP